MRLSRMISDADRLNVLQQQIIDQCREEDRAELARPVAQRGLEQIEAYTLAPGFSWLARAGTTKANTMTEQPERWCVRCRRAAPPAVLYPLKGICTECRAAEQNLRSYWHPREVRIRQFRDCCPAGHKDSFVVDSRGWRRCRECERLRVRVRDRGQLHRQRVRA